MTGRDAFKIWAPPGVRWVDWVRPVPFTAIHNSHNPNTTVSFSIPSIVYRNTLPENTAIVVDAPGCDGAKEGIALAQMGFRPIPLYNGTREQEGAMALVDNHTIEKALIWGASELEKLTILPKAPPVFLLDSNRTHQYKMDASVFDNSWDIYHQDMPSAEYLLDNGIERMLVRGETIQKDLGRILYKYQKKRITILFTNGYTPPKAVAIKRPRRKSS